MSSSIQHDVFEWAARLPYWQQYALNKLIGGAPANDALIGETFEYFLAENNLKKTHKQFDPIIFLAPSLTGLAKRARLAAIKNANNINTLVPGQTLPVGDQLTCVYGGNGSGKSGYARILGAAGFTRGNKEILCDVGLNSQTQMTVEFELSTGSHKTDAGRSVPQLGGCYVFDSASVLAQLTRPNAISYTPSGLESLKQLSDITAGVATRLQSLISATRKPSTFKSPFTEASQVSQLIHAISADTQTAALTTLAVFGDEEVKRLEFIEKDLASLIAQDPRALAQGITRDTSSLQGLLDALKACQSILSNDRVAAINDAVAERNKAFESMSANSIEQFHNPRLASVGTPAWIEFIRLASEVAHGENPECSYPADGDVCLLCQQELSESARQLMHRAWQYAAGKLKEAYDDAEANLTKISSDLSNLKNRLQMHDYATQVARAADEGIGEATGALIESCAKAMDDLLSSIDLRFSASMPVIGFGLLADLQRLIDGNHRMISDLQSRNTVAEIAKRKAAQIELQHRRLLATMLAQILDFISCERWCNQATACVPTTKAITDKYNKLFTELASANYMARFSKYVELFLHESVKVSIKTSGKLGETLKSIVLDVAPRQRPDKVLSEGEQRAIAMADFLAEAAANPDCTALVFDDPATSFDMEWREAAAQVIAQESASRQVLVFTHDLAFLYWLHEAANSNSIQIRSHWMTRDEAGNPGFIAIDNSPTMEQQYRNSEKADSCLKRAQAAINIEEKQLWLKQGFTALRSSYEAVILFDVLNGCVVRFNERISIERFRQICWSQAAVDKLLSGYDSLCNFMEGHLHSDALGNGNVHMQKMKDEIAEFNRVREAIRAARKPGAVVANQPLQMVKKTS